MSTKNESATAVTGVGSISAGAPNLDALWVRAEKAEPSVTIRHVPQVSRPLPVYAISDLPRHARDVRLTRSADRSARLALIAAREAWASAELDLNPVDPARCGLIIGSSRGPVEVNGLAHASARKHPTDSVYSAFSSIAGVLASALPIQGCSLMTSATCVSGAMAIKMARQWIQTGEFDLVVVGGVDAPLTDSLLAQFAATQVLAAGAGAGSLRPFDRGRTGTVLGEGAAFFVLESQRSAARRSARIHGYIDHVAVGCDSNLRAGGDRSGSGLRRTTQLALSAMGAAPASIDLIHLHGTGTVLNDAIESQCVADIFGPQARQPWCWASKGITGHTLGASATFQVLLTLKAFAAEFVPSTANLKELDPACPIRLSQFAGERLKLSRGLCLTSGFWGNTSCVGLRKTLPTHE